MFVETTLLYKNIFGQKTSLLALLIEKNPCEIGVIYNAYLEAKLMVSPKRQNLGILLPITPATVFPEWIPMRT